MTAWVKSPETVVTLDGPKVTGPVGVVWQNDGHAFVRTDAHVNDDKPCVRFRDTDHLVSLRCVRAEDGTWSLHPGTHQSIQRRETWDDAPRTHKAAIVEAILSALAQHWTPDLQRQANYAEACQHLTSLEGERDNLAAKLADVRKQIRAEQRKADANA